MNFTQLFKTKKDKVLKLEWSNPLQTRKVSSHAVLLINQKLYYRKDEVERLMQKVIDLKIANGELAVIQLKKIEINANE